MKLILNLFLLLLAFFSFSNKSFSLSDYQIKRYCRKEKNESDKNKMTSDIFEKLSLSANKAEKDIGIYKSSISKMEQAKELIEELRTKNEKKD